MKIEIFGSGCHKCVEMEKRATEAVSIAGVSATVAHVYDMKIYIGKGIFMTPALAIDGKVVITGRVPSVDEIVSCIKKDD